MCQPCHYSCLSCSTASTCNTCDPSKFRMLDSVTGRCICRDGFYDDSFNNQVCVACERSCLKCRDGGSCSECDSTKKRVKNNTADYNSIVNPYCSCFYKHFPQPDVRLSCLSCHYSCAACSNSLMTSCLFCTKDARRVMNVAMRRCLCEDGYYDNGLD